MKVFIVSQEWGCDDGTASMTRLFGGGYQENCDNYLEIHIERHGVK